MSIQYSGGTIRNDLYNAVTLTTFLSSLNTSLVAAGWTATAFKAHSTLTVTANPANNETVTLGAKVYTYKTVIGAPANEVLIGADASASLDNLKAAVNGSAGSGTLYSAATVAHTLLDATTKTATTLKFEQKTGGLTSALASTETLANGSFDTAVLSYGGYKFVTAETPQFLKTQVYIFDASGSGNFIFFNTFMADESLAGGQTAGGTRFQMFVNGLNIRVIANKYQFFVLEDGSAGNTGDKFFASGTPAIPSFMAGKKVSGATNATPIVITTTAAHNYVTGYQVTTKYIGGNTAANGTFNVTVLNSTQFSLDGSVGNGAYTSGGVVGRVGKEVYEAGWAAGSNASLPMFRATLGASTKHHWAARNGTGFYSSSGANGSGALSIVLAVPSLLTEGLNEMLWFNGSNLAQEPFIGWGDSYAGTFKLTGQLWDALTIAKAFTKDITGTFDGHLWWNFTDNNTGGLVGNNGESSLFLAVS